MRISPIYYSSLLLTALHMAPAAEYYVATDGKDGNIGMSISNPWQTISRAVGHPGLTGGDTIHVRGGRYPEQVHVARSGLVNKPITIKAYVGETPVVDGNGINFQTLPNIGGVFQIVGSNVIIDGLRVINATVAENAVGILVRGPGVSNVTVRNCSTDNTRSSGIAAWGNSVDYSGIQNVRIEHNTITNAVNNGYQECLTISAGVDGFEVSGNTVRDCYSVPHEPNIPLGIDAKVNVRNGNIHDNLLFNLPYCSGIYVDGWDNTAYNIDIYNNVIHDVGHAGIQIGSEEGGTVYNINIFNNLIYKVRENGFAINHSNVSTPPNLYDIHFYQNTVYGSGYYAAHITADCRNLVVNNNIFS